MRDRITPALFIAGILTFAGLGALTFAAHVYYFKFMLWFLGR